MNFTEFQKQVIDHVEHWVDQNGGNLHYRSDMVREFSIGEMNITAYTHEDELTIVTNYLKRFTSGSNGTGSESLCRIRPIRIGDFKVFQTHLPKKIFVMDYRTGMNFERHSTRNPQEFWDKLKEPLMSRLEYRMQQFKEVEQ